MTSNGDPKTVTKRKLNGDRVEIPVWAMSVTYILCWTLGLLMVLVQAFGHVTYRPLLICVSIYLILWPVFQVSPAEMIRKIFPGGG